MREGKQPGHRRANSRVSDSFRRDKLTIHLWTASCLVGLLLLSASRAATGSLPSRLVAGGVATATDTDAPCADMPCNSGDTCDCIKVSGPADHIGSGSLRVLSISYELSVDESAALDDGDEGGECMPSTGKGVFRVKDNSTIDFVVSGLNCTVPGLASHALFNGTLLLEGGTAYGGKILGLGSMHINTPAIGTTEYPYAQMWATDDEIHPGGDPR
jgi:hypothetical protein